MDEVLRKFEGGSFNSFPADFEGVVDLSILSYFSNKYTTFLVIGGGHTAYNRLFQFFEVVIRRITVYTLDYTTGYTEKNILRSSYTQYNCVYPGLHPCINLIFEPGIFAEFK